MTTPADDSTETRRWAFRMAPQCERTGDGWRVSYPDAGWSVTAPSEEEARQKFAEEVTRRRDSGEQPKGFEDAVYREHLRNPIPGVYAMDAELYRYLVREVTGYDWDALQPVFEESERLRALGQSYTKADYLAATNRKIDLGD
jgi:hypothetical protein